VNESSSENGEEGWVVHRTRYGRATGKKGRYDPASGKTINWTDDVVGAGIDVTSNYYDVLDIDEQEKEVLQSNHEEIMEYINVGAGIGVEALLALSS
jgi:hypothetical protein